VKKLPVSTTTRPVTHTADVDVKIASTHDIEPVFTEKGSFKSRTPIAIGAYIGLIMLLSNLDHCYRFCISLSLLFSASLSVSSLNRMRVRGQEY
jgi:hypothetical protein